MKVQCPSCQSALNVDDKKIPSGGARIKCPSCGGVFSVKGVTSASSAPASVPLPAPPTAVPLPGVTAAPARRQAWEVDATRAIASPPPESSAFPESEGAAVPLPGEASLPPPLPTWEKEATRAVRMAPTSDASNLSPAAPAHPSVALPGKPLAIPLPAPPSLDDPAAEGAVALPGAQHDFSESPTSIAPALAPEPQRQPPPLRSRAAPVGTPQVSGAIPLPGHSTGALEADDSVPLPGGQEPLTSGEGLGFDPISDSSDLQEVSGFDLIGPAETGFSETSTRIDDAPVQPAPPPLGLEQNERHGQRFEFSDPPPLRSDDQALAAPPQQGDPGDLEFIPPAEPAPSGFDFASPPAAQAPGGFDFAPPPRAEAPGGFHVAPPAPAEAPAPGAFDFAPPPLMDPPGGFDFAPPPPSQPPGSFDFAPPPPSQAPGGFDFAPPPPPAQPMGFGEVDLGEQRQSPSLEFGASAGAAGDSLEADFGAPRAPEASGPVDGLEMLSFIDDTAHEVGAPTTSAAVRRLHVKRRSGKVFGPFEEGVIVKMLEAGQLLGNEEISVDLESWQPIGSQPVFHDAIAALLAAPGAASGAAAAAPGAAAGAPLSDRPQGPSLDHLRQLYEGRMAAVAVVQAKEPIQFKKYIPAAAGALAVLLLLGIGLGLGATTPYGFFGLKLLFPAKIRPDTREFGYLAQARAGLEADTWKSLRAAKAAAEQALQVKEYPEARALWCQAIFYLDRKHKGSSPADVAKARDSLVGIRLLGAKHPEVLKAMAGDALSRRQADEALTFISDAVARDEGDIEALFLRAEALLLKKQTGQARTDYLAIIKKRPTSARAFHALATVESAAGQSDDAAGHFAQALEASGDHVSSAVALADLLIDKRGDAPRGKELLEQALSDSARENLGASELSVALALMGEQTVAEGKPAEAVSLFEEALTADGSNAFAQAHLAKAFLQLNEPEKAVPLFAKAAASAPDRLEYAEGHLSALILVGKMDEATRVVQAATARFPGNAKLAYLSGRVADALDNPKQAEEAYKRAIAADDTITDASLYLSRLYMRFRRFQEARPQLEAGLAKAPNDAALRVGMGELAYHEREFDRAEEEFNKAVELNPVSAEAHLGLSRINGEKGQYEAAETQADQALKLNPRIPGGKLQRGVVLWKLGRLDEALEILNEAREQEPKNTQVIVTLGAVEFEKGNLDEANKLLESALSGNPTHPDANFYLARIKNARRENTQAIEALKRSLDSDPRNPVYHYWMGRAMADGRRTEDAISEWKAALALDPKHADSYEALGKVYSERNKFRKAVEAFQEALGIDPGRVGTLSLLGDAQMRLGDWKGAVDSFQRALEASPEAPGAAFRLAQALEEAHEAPKAIEQYQSALEKDPQNGDAWLRLGWLYKDTKKRKDARLAFEKYLEIRPEAENKKEIEDEIEFLKGK